MTRKLQASGQRRMVMKEMGKSIIEAMSATMGDTLTVNVKNFEVCGNKSKVRVAVVASAGSTKTDIRNAINEKFQGKLRAVAGSFSIVESSNADRSNVQATLEGYVVPNVEIVTASSEEGKTMKCVAANMFLDQADCIWSKTGDFLYKKSDVETSEELNRFLTECSSSTVRMRKADKLGSTEVSSGNFVSYLSEGEMCYGFVIATDEANQKLMVLAEGEEDPEVIDTFDVQTQVPVDDEKVAFPEEEEFTETSAAGIDVNALVSYYKRWFQYNKQYAEQLISRAKGHSFC
jgi:hypothetical protein